MRVCHIINCLSVGGTERQLIRLVAARSPGVEASIVTLLDRDTLASQAEQAGARLHCLGLSASRPAPMALMRLAGILREERPDLVQSWLYYANAAATLARPLARASSQGRWPLVWNLRQTVESLDQEGRALRLAFRLNRWLSGRPEAVVSNSRRSLEDHRRLGFRPRREEVIPNGFDISAIERGPGAASAARRTMGLPEDALVVGVVGRDHPLKDHEGALHAMTRVLARREHFDGRNVLLVMIGRGVDAAHPTIPAAIGRLRLGERVRLLGERLDLFSLYAGFDCLVSGSAAMEAFPNVVAEALCAGVPVVATDVGECREIVGQAGRLVPARDPDALAEAIVWLLSLDARERGRLGDLGRAGVLARYDIREVAKRYERLWEELIRRS